MKRLRLSLSCGLLASCLLGIAGVRDSDRRKQPLVAISTILGWAYLSRLEIQ
jgi:hypothetical protein